MLEVGRVLGKAQFYGGGLSHGGTTPATYTGGLLEWSNNSGESGQDADAGGSGKNGCFRK